MQAQLIMRFSIVDFPYKRPPRTIVLFQSVFEHHSEKMRYKFLVLFVVSLWWSWNFVQLPLWIITY